MAGGTANLAVAPIRDLPSTICHLVFQGGPSGSGRRYTSFSLPGTGVGYRTYKKGGGG